MLCRHEGLWVQSATVAQLAGRRIATAAAAHACHTWQTNQPRMLKQMGLEDERTEVNKMAETIRLSPGHCVQAVSMLRWQRRFSARHKQLRLAALPADGAKPPSTCQEPDAAQAHRAGWWCWIHLPAPIPAGDVLPPAVLPALPAATAAAAAWRPEQLPQQSVPRRPFCRPSRRGPA